MIFPQVLKPPKLLRPAYPHKIQGMNITSIIVDELAEPTKIGFTDKQVQVIMDLKDMIKTKLEAQLMHLPSVLIGHLKQYTVLTGGAISSIVHFEHPNDWDLYFKSTAAMHNVEQYCWENKDIIKNVNPNYAVDTIINGKCVTTRATTLIKDIQLITMGGVEMIDFFDYKHCQPYYDLLTDKLYISPKQFDAIMHKKLVKNPKSVQTFSRENKFLERGWKLA